MEDVVDLIDRLCIVNNKLFSVCDQKSTMGLNPSAYTKEQFAALVIKDVSLCEERSKLKNEIRKYLGLSSGEVKLYGK